MTQEPTKKGLQKGENENDPVSLLRNSEVGKKKSNDIKRNAEKTMDRSRKENLNRSALKHYDPSGGEGH